MSIGHAANQYAWVYESFDNDVCVSNWSEVTAGGADNGGWTRSESNTWFNDHCSQKIPRPANSVHVRTDILAFNLELGQRYVCWSSPYETNPAGQHRIGVSDNINRFCNPPGGGRWYANTTLAEAENIAGSWRGGWLASGNEWVGPAFTATKAPERPKISAREAIERGQIRAGSPTGPKFPLSCFEGKTAAPPALALRTSKNAPTLAGIPRIARRRVSHAPCAVRNVERPATAAGSVLVDLFATPAVVGVGVCHIRGAGAGPAHLSDEAAQGREPDLVRVCLRGTPGPRRLPPRQASRRIGDLGACQAPASGRGLARRGPAIGPGRGSLVP